MLKKLKRRVNKIKKLAKKWCLLSHPKQSRELAMHPSFSLVNCYKGCRVQTISSKVFRIYIFNLIKGIKYKIK